MESDIISKKSNPKHRRNVHEIRFPKMKKELSDDYTRNVDPFCGELRCFNTYGAKLDGPPELGTGVLCLVQGVGRNRVPVEVESKDGTPILMVDGAAMSALKQWTDEDDTPKNRVALTNVYKVKLTTGGYGPSFQLRSARVAGKALPKRGGVKAPAYILNRKVALRFPPPPLDADLVLWKGEHATLLTFIAGELLAGKPSNAVDPYSDFPNVADQSVRNVRAFGCMHGPKHRLKSPLRDNYDCWGGPLCPAEEHNGLTFCGLGTPDANWELNFARYMVDLAVWTATLPVPTSDLPPVELPDYVRALGSLSVSPDVKHGDLEAAYSCAKVRSLYEAVHSVMRATREQSSLVQYWVKDGPNTGKPRAPFSSKDDYESYRCLSPRQPSPLYVKALPSSLKAPLVSTHIEREREEMLVYLSSDDDSDSDYVSDYTSTSSPDEHLCDDCAILSCPGIKGGSDTSSCSHCAYHQKTNLPLNLFSRTSQFLPYAAFNKRKRAPLDSVDQLMKLKLTDLNDCSVRRTTANKPSLAQFLDEARIPLTTILGR